MRVYIYLNSRDALEKALRNWYYNRYSEESLWGIYQALKDNTRKVRILQSAENFGLRVVYFVLHYPLDEP